MRKFLIRWWWTADTPRQRTEQSILEWAANRVIADALAELTAKVINGEVDANTIDSAQLQGHRKALEEMILIQHKLSQVN